MKSLVQHHSKRWWLVIGVSATIILLIGAYSVYSVTSWNSYQQRTQAWQSTNKQRLATALTLKVTTDDQRSRKLTSLKAVTANIRSAQSHMCTPARLTGWQLAFNVPRGVREGCEVYSKKVGLIAEQLSRVTTYLEDELRVTSALRPALELPDAVSEANWQQTATVWGQLHTNVTNLPVSSSFNLTKQQATSVTLALEAGWKELIAAHGAKDKARFVAATAKLQEGYTGLAGISTISDSQLTLLTVRLQQLYSTL